MIIPVFDDVNIHHLHSTSSLLPESVWDTKVSTINVDMRPPTMWRCCKFFKKSSEPHFLDLVYAILQLTCACKHARCQYCPRHYVQTYNYTGCQHPPCETCTSHEMEWCWWWFPEMGFDEVWILIDSIDSDNNAYTQLVQILFPPLSVKAFV